MTIATQSGTPPTKGNSRLAARFDFAPRELRVLDASGRLVATAHGTWHLWPHKPEMEKPASEPYVVRHRNPIGKGFLIVSKLLLLGYSHVSDGAKLTSTSLGSLLEMMLPGGDAIFANIRDIIASSVNVQKILEAFHGGF